MPFGGMLTGAGISVAGSLLGGLLGSNAAGQASKQYVQALQAAEQYLKEGQQQGLQNYSPYLQTGQTANLQLSDLLGNLSAPWTGSFTAPTAAQAEQTPGYQFQLQQGENAIQNSAAGRGSLLTGRTMADLNNFAQGTAATNYQNVFNNAFTQYQSAYNSFLNNQNNTYAKLMGVNQQGLEAAGGAANLYSGIGGDISKLMAGVGAAQAGGTIGQANAWSGALGGAFGGLSNALTLSSLMNSNTPEYARGTESARGGVAIVGEKGPEAVILPRGSKVIPNKKLRAVHVIESWMVPGGGARTLRALA